MSLRHIKINKKTKALTIKFRWLSICVFHTGFISSTAFSSQIISSSTKTSKRSPSLKVIPSYIPMQSGEHLPAFDIPIPS